MTQDMTVEEKQLVLFDLSNEAYGIDISAVHEIIRMQPVTRVPRTPSFVEGIINLRGKVIPVIDLRKRFGFDITEQTRDNRIVVVDIDGENIGIIVDAVTEVLRIPADSVEPPSNIITTADSDYLLGIAKVDNKLIILLDLHRILSHEETGVLPETLMATNTKEPAAATNKNKKLSATNDNDSGNKKKETTMSEMAMAGTAKTCND